MGNGEGFVAGQERTRRETGDDRCTVQELVEINFMQESADDTDFDRMTIFRMTGCN